MCASGSCRGDAAEDNLLDEAAQQSLTLSSGEQIRIPNLRQPPADVPEGGLQLLRQLRGGGSVFVFITDGFALLCPPEFAQGYLPSPLQLRGHEAVVRVGSLEAPAGELGLVMEALELLTAGVFGG
jgi:hypothetical protein